MLGPPRGRKSSRIPGSTFLDRLYSPAGRKNRRSRNQANRRRGRPVCRTAAADREVARENRTDESQPVFYGFPAVGNNVFPLTEGKKNKRNAIQKEACSNRFSIEKGKAPQATLFLFFRRVTTKTEKVVGGLAHHFAQCRVRVDGIGEIGDRGIEEISAAISAIVSVARREMIAAPRSLPVLASETILTSPVSTPTRGLSPVAGMWYRPTRTVYPRASACV